METSLGGPQEAFPETAWSTVLSCADPLSPRRVEALNRLFARYWRPVYRVIRTAGRKSIEDAKDLTQGFFCYILEEDVISKAQPDRGRFRSFLKGTLRNYLSESRRHDRSLKRGGDRAALSLDTDAVERDGLTIPDSASPDEIFDRQWAWDVLREGVEELRRQLLDEGRSDCWRAYESYELAANRPTYEETARSLGLSVSQVKDHLTRCRDRLRDLVARGVADGVASREEFIQEMRDLFSR